MSTYHMPGSVFYALLKGVIFPILQVEMKVT